MFGQRNFEVMQTTRPHVFKTAKPVDGYDYEFYVTSSTTTAPAEPGRTSLNSEGLSEVESGSTLTVVEIDLQRNCKLELLNCTAQVRSQGL